VPLPAGWPIRPCAFAGGGEAIPTVANRYRLGRLFGAPYIPITPWIAALPRPTRLDVYYGAPMRFEGTGREEDHVIAGWVAQVKGRIADMLAHGVRQRRERAPTRRLLRSP